MATIDGHRLVLDRHDTSAYESGTRCIAHRAARKLADRIGRTVEIVAHDGVVLDRVEGYLANSRER